LKQYLTAREDRRAGAKERRKSRRKKKRAHTPQQFDLREALFRMTGVDLTRIDGIDIITAATVISEAGWDMSKWRTENHFVSRLRLCPDNKISGERIIGKGKLPNNNRLTSALKMAATSLKQSNTYLGAEFRRLRTRLGAPVAIKAMAAKLARLIYRMLRSGVEYAIKGRRFRRSKTASAKSLSSNERRWNKASKSLNRLQQYFYTGPLFQARCESVGRQLRVCRM
jgi:hypothetical protein